MMDRNMPQDSVEVEPMTLDELMDNWLAPHVIAGFGGMLISYVNQSWMVGLHNPTGQLIEAARDGAGSAVLGGYALTSMYSLYKALRD